MSSVARVSEEPLALRSARLAALGDSVRLAIVDELALSDRSPIELRRLLGLESNLVAHHLDVLETVGLITRTPSNSDRRRRYARLRHDALVGLMPSGAIRPCAALFVCTANSARSPLAAALWRQLTLGVSATSAGTHPAARLHPAAVAAAARAGLDLGDAKPRDLLHIESLPPLVVTVCDQAREGLLAAGRGVNPVTHWLHWSIPDPVRSGTGAAFDQTVEILRTRIRSLLGSGTHVATAAATPVATGSGTASARGRPAAPTTARHGASDA